VSAFGKKLGGNKPAFGVAKPMAGAKPNEAEQPKAEGVEPETEGGEQFPPIDSVELPGQSAAPAAEPDAN